MNTLLLDLIELRNKLKSNSIKNKIAISWLTKQIKNLEYKEVLKNF